MLIKRILTFIIFFNLLFFIYLKSAAYLDTTFGINATGIVEKTFSSPFYVRDLKVNSANKIIIAGECLVNGNLKMALAQFNNDGSLDTTFGNNGIIISSNNQISSAQAITIDSSNNIIVTGYSENNIFVSRYNSTGVIDSTFAENGIAKLIVGESSYANAISIDNFNMIFITGTATINAQAHIVVAKFDSNGTLDISFNSIGVKTITGESHFYSKSIAIDANQNIVIGGNASTINGNEFLIIRLNFEGNLDLSFNNSGIKLGRILGFNSNLKNLVINSSNKLIIAGDSQKNDESYFALLQLNSDGTIDNSFGNQGQILTQLGKTVSCTTSLIDESGKIYLAGTVDERMCVVKYNINGSLDTSFAKDGILFTSNGHDNSLNSFSIQPSDKKIIIAGIEKIIKDANLSKKLILVRSNKNNTDYINILNPALNSSIKSKTPVISGSSSAANAQVQVFLNGNLTSTISTDGSGNWSTTSPLLTSGTHKILVNLIFNSSIIASKVIYFNIIDISGEDTILAYSTNTQTTSTINEFQLITFNSISQNNASIWTTVGNNTLKYVSSIPGKFLLFYRTHVGILNAATSSTLNISVRILKNGSEIHASQIHTIFQINSGSNYVQNLSNAVAVNLAQNDTIQLQYATNISGAGIIAGQGAGVTKPSIVINVLRIL